MIKANNRCTQKKVRNISKVNNKNTRLEKEKKMKLNCWNTFFFKTQQVYKRLRGGSRTAATSKVELFMIIVNGWKPLTIIMTKSSTLDVAAVFDPPLRLALGK